MLIALMEAARFAMDDGVVYKLSNCEIMRLDVDDSHHYYGGPLGGEKQYYLSLTQVLDLAAPFPEGLKMYMRVTSYEEQKEWLGFTATRGTNLHHALDTLMHREELDMQEFKSTYEKDAVVTFIQMMRFLDPGKYETEIIVADPDLRVAGTLDFKGFVQEWKLLCLLEPLKYLEVDSDGDLQLKEKWLDLPNSKRVHIIIDWKFSSRNAYNHKIQVSAYRAMNNKSRNGVPVSRAFTWRYSPKHKFRFDFQESDKPYRAFKRIYDTCIDFLGDFPQPPVVRRYPKQVRLYDKVNKVKEK